MQDPKHNIKNKAAAYRILLVEAALTAVLAILLLISVDIVTAYSAALGGLAFVVPNAAFARYVFRHSAADSASLAMRGFYIGEAVKIVMTVVIFAVCFTLVEPLSVIALFATYIAMMAVNLTGLALIGSK